MLIGANAKHADPYRPVAHSAIATPEVAKTSAATRIAQRWPYAMHVLIERPPWKAVVGLSSG
jgi:hypothetical protein